MGASVFLRGIDSRHLKDGPDGTIVVEIGGADDFEFTANTLTAKSGSTVATDTIAETTAGSGVTIDSVLLKDGAVTPTAAGGVVTDIIAERTAATGVTIDSVKCKDGEVIVTTGAGAAAGTGVTAEEKASGARQVTITLAATTIPLTDEAGVVAYGGLKVYDMPAGAILFLGAVSDLAITKSSAGVNADWDGDFGLGTTTAGNNNALAGTEQDLIPTTATPQAVAGATTADGESTSTEACKVFDGTTDAVDVYLNFLVDDADHDVTGTACNLIVNGTIKLTYINLGDN